jgi:hypothetical protein
MTRLENAFCNLVEVVAGGNANDLFNRADSEASSAASEVLDIYWAIVHERG